MTDRKQEDERRFDTQGHTESEAEKERRRFAKALARDAFGRHYWDERMAMEVRRAARKRRR